MKTNNLFLLLLSVFLLNSAQANLPGLSSTYTRHLQKTRAVLMSKGYSTAPAPKTCHSQLLNIAQDNRIDVTLAFGYMDVSGGQNIKDSASDLYGNGDVLDLDAKEAMQNVLMMSCQGNSNFACGFRRSGNVLSKRVRNRFTGKSIDVRVTLLAPSVSSSNAQNSNQLATKQLNSSANVRNGFLNSFKTADAVIYLGHARSGGGPDFKPPVLLSNGHVNYSHYKSKQEGIGSMLSVLKSSGRTIPLIGVLACKSTGLFSSRIRSASPGSILVTADDLFDYNDILPTGYAMLEAIISQRCTDNFEKTTKIQTSSSKFLKIFF